MAPRGSNRSQPNEISNYGLLLFPFGPLHKGGEPYTVVGIMPEGFEFPAGDPDVEVWMPLTLSEQAQLDRPHRMYNVVGRLSAGITIDEAQSELDTIAAQMSLEFPATNEGWCRSGKRRSPAPGRVV